MKRFVLCIALSMAGGCHWGDIRPDTPALDVKVPALEREGVPPDERYYVIVFGSQSPLKRPKYTHTWATFIKVTDPEFGLKVDVEPSTISWMPKTLDIKAWNLTVEPGVNLELIETVELMLKSEQRVSMWGPYEMRPGLYKKLMIQKDFLERSGIGYQCVDTYGEAARKRNGCDCIHAITDADNEFDRRHYHLRRYGETASEFIVQQCFERGLLIKPERTHDWLIPKLGLDKHPIVHRKYNGWNLSADEGIPPPTDKPESERATPLQPARF
jgi:hypothetical protein